MDWKKEILFLVLKDKIERKMLESRPEDALVKLVKTVETVETVETEATEETVET